MSDGGETEWPDTTAMDVAEFYAWCRDDAMRWAVAFCQHERKHGFTIDKDVMVGWFANAIEHSHDVRTGGGPTVLPDGSAFIVTEAFGREVRPLEQEE